MSTIPATPSERLAGAAAELLAALPPNVRSESFDLAALEEVGSMGLRVHYIEGEDRFDLVWLGRWLGSVDAAYIRDGVFPS